MSLGLRQLLLRRAVLGGGLPPEIAADINQSARSSHPPPYLPKFPFLRSRLIRTNRHTAANIASSLPGARTTCPPHPLLLLRAVVCFSACGIYHHHQPHHQQVVILKCAIKCSRIRSAHKVTPAGLEPAIPGSVGRCLIHWATGPSDVPIPLSVLHNPYAL